jgi:hypothetical protein
MISPNAKRHRIRQPDAKAGSKITQVPAELEIAVPALLQLNRGSQPENRSIHPAPCAIPIVPLADCTKCQATATESCFNSHCNTCWADCTSHCASPCDEGDDCHIAQPCYDEHCASDVCPDESCPVDPCNDTTCAEVVHCDTTCFDDSCIWPMNGIQGTSFDPQLCVQGECYGFLPCASGLQDWNQGHNISDHLPQYTSHITGNEWNQPLNQTFSHDHINPSNHHKRRKTAEIGQSDQGIYSYQSAPVYQEPWQSHMHNGYGLPTFAPQHNHSPSSQTFDSQNWNGCHFDFMGSADMQSYTNASSQQGTYTPNLAHSNAVDGLICGLSHVTASAQAVDTSTFDHSPFCEQANNKRSRSKSVRPVQRHKKDSASPPLHTPSNSDDSQPTIFSATLPTPSSSDSSPTFDNFKTEFKDEESDWTCKWIIKSGEGEDSQTICSRSFTSSKELDEHLQTEHTNKLGAQQFVCHWAGCNTPFKHRGKLNRHISGAHSRCRYSSQLLFRVRLT